MVNLSRCLVAAALMAFGISAGAQGLRGAQGQTGQVTKPLDGIAAVVNASVITVREVEAEAQDLITELRAKRQPIPPENILLKQALDSLITNALISQEAKNLGITVTPKDVARAVEMVAQRNRITPAQLQAQVKRMGLTWEDYLDQLEDDLLVDLVRQKMADMSVRVSNTDVDAFMKEKAARKASGLEPPPPPPPPPPKPRPAQPLVLQISQIFIRVPEGASPQDVAQFRKTIDDIRARLKRGEKFAQVATAFSDGPEASRGGDLGVRPASGWPEIFLKVARNLQPGQISGVIRSPAGFHILLVTGRAGGEQAQPAPPPVQAEVKEPTGPMMVNQTKARHILIKTSAVMSDSQAQQRLMAARGRIVQGGESFESVARAVSDDASAPLGGELGWLNPGETVPEFERAMDALEVGQVSEPVQSPFGWHLILVQERRTQDMADQYRRNVARQELYRRRAQARFDAWLQQIRNMAYIDNRMFRQPKQ